MSIGPPRGLRYPLTFLFDYTQPIIININYHLPYIFHMPSPQKSFLSTRTKDTNTLPPPIHAGQTSYPIYRATQNLKQKPKGLPFGSSSSRVSSQLAPMMNCKVSSYASIQYKESSICKNFRAPFGSLEDRFLHRIEKSPGPANYNIRVSEPSQKKKGYGVIGQAQKNSLLKQELQIGPGSYDIKQQNERSALRKKIKEKAKLIMEKYHIGANKLKKSNQLLPEVSSNQKQNCSETAPQPSPKKFIPERRLPDRFQLKNNTDKYLTQQSYSDFYIPQLQTTYSGSCNFSPYFIETKQNRFQSYIQPSCSPGPGAYPRKLKDVFRGSGASSSFNSKVARKVFQEGGGPKDKIKLSCIL